MSFNVMFDWDVNQNYLVSIGAQYNKGINGRNSYGVDDIINFNSSNIDDSNRAEIFYDTTFFIICNIKLGG